MYKRDMSRIISRRMGRGQAIILIGPRQVGKTTLINDLLRDEKYLFLDADDPTVRHLLTEPNTEQLKSIIGNT